MLQLVSWVTNWLLVLQSSICSLVPYVIYAYWKNFPDCYEDQKLCLDFTRERRSEGHNPTRERRSEGHKSHIASVELKTEPNRIMHTPTPPNISNPQMHWSHLLSSWILGGGVFCMRSCPALGSCFLQWNYCLEKMKG